MTTLPRSTATASPAPTGRPRRWPSLLSGFYWALIVLLYLPILILFFFSLNAGTSLSFPLKGFTLSWYAKLFDTPALLEAVRTSLLVAVGSSVVATALGTMVGILLSRFEFRGKGLLTGLAVLPLIVPYVVLGVALLILFTAFDIKLSMATVVIGHAIVGLPYTTLIVLARLVGSEAQLEEAAMDLVPMAMPAIISAWITAFTVSFDEFAIALFLAGPDRTFPVYLYGQLRFSNSLPVLIAAATLLMAGTLTLILVADRIRRR
jgi:spermidine/putrescine transport system permease protein